jgi:hypothetical protein
MNGVRCEVVRWLSDEPQPGWVEASIVDAQGRRWSFFDKPAIFSDEGIGPSSEFPLPGVIRCEIVSTNQGDGGVRSSRVEIRLQDGVESAEGSTRFLVEADEVIALES